MSGKFMKVASRIIISTFTMAILVSQLCGCAGCSKDELNSMMNTSSLVQIDINEPVSSTDSTNGDTDPVVKEALRWEKLGNLSTYVPVRRAVNDTFGITGASNGSIYVDAEGNQNINNTLYNALKNTAFTDVLNDPNVMNSLSLMASDNFTDLSDGDNIPAVFNSYWDLLPEEDGEETKEFNGSASLTRAQAMTLVTRAMTMVTDDGIPKSNADFTNAVGESLYTDFASYMNENVYMGTVDKSLTKETFKGPMTRAEYIYMVTKSVYGDAVDSFDKKITLDDCKDGGDIASKQSYTGNNGAAYEIAYMLQNPDGGVSTKLYKAIAMANSLGVIDTTTRWDESITKSEAIQIFIDTVKGTEAQTDKAEGAVDTEALAERAREHYEHIKGNLDCDEDTYVKEVIEHVTELKEDEETALFNVAQKHKKPIPSNPVESKPVSSSSKPAQSSSKPQSSKPASSSSSKPQSSSSSTQSSVEPIDEEPIEDNNQWGDPATNTFHGTPSDTTGWKLDETGKPVDKIKWARTNGRVFFDKDGIGWGTSGGRWEKLDQYGGIDHSNY